jgi:hypothetical protein
VRHARVSGEPLIVSDCTAFTELTDCTLHSPLRLILDGSAEARFHDLAIDVNSAAKSCKR